jgi:hypothetical protein
MKAVEEIIILYCLRQGGLTGSDWGGSRILSFPAPIRHLPPSPPHGTRGRRPFAANLCEITSLRIIAFRRRWTFRPLAFDQLRARLSPRLSDPDGYADFT